MSAATSFTFDGSATIRDLLMVAETLRQSGQQATLRFVRSYTGEIGSVAVDAGPEIGAEESARPGEMAVVGEDSLSDPRD